MVLLTQQCLQVGASNLHAGSLTLSDTAVLQYTGGTTGVSKGDRI